MFNVVLRSLSPKNFIGNFGGSLVESRSPPLPSSAVPPLSPPHKLSLESRVRRGIPNFPLLHKLRRELWQELRRFPKVLIRNSPLFPSELRCSMFDVGRLLNVKMLL